jgi:DNA polymerase-3 subunit alpha
MAKAKGLNTIALTDINNSSATLNFVRLAAKYNIKPIAGIDFRNGIKQLYIGLAKNNEGFYELNSFLSEYLHKKINLPEQAPELTNTFFVYPFTQAENLKKYHLNKNEYIGVSIKDLARLPFLRFIEYKDKLVVLQTVSFRHKKDFNTHRLLRAIDNNILLSKLPKNKQADENDKMLPLTKLKEHFKNYPFIIENTEKLMEKCSIEFDFSKKSQNQQSYTGSKKEDERLLMDLCKKNLAYRYPQINDKIIKRLEKELALIKKMNFISYFLINWDIVEYAKSQNYFHIGRGSGANSIVAYLLGITDVDPIDLDLYFERFINLYRSSPPDFDIDFSWKDRADVTAYIFKRFPNVALLATYNTFAYNSAVRELGKVFGLPKHEIDDLANKKFSPDKLDELSRLVLIYAKQLQGLPNHRSIHAGGILISEKPLHYFSATDLPPKNFPTVQFDMVIAEDAGLHKFDILGQRGLAKIKDALKIIQKNKKELPKIDLHDMNVLKSDEKIKNLIRNAQCLGCFYVESPAMRMLLKKLEVDNYLGLVAASSIIRPGVARSGMMREYILRHKDPAKRKQAHPVMWQLMEETYGIMVYQEDVIKVAHHFAGLSLGEADVLRRAMSGKYRSREEFLKVKQKFFDNCYAKGYNKQLVSEIWLQIESFAGYAFAKGHSASYAVESYQSLYLKAHYPLEYLVAVLNNGGGFYDTETYIHEARMLGATIHAPDINKSEYLCEIQANDIYIGLGFIKELEHGNIVQIITERNKKGAFVSFEDFTERVNISVEQLILLIRAGTFEFTGIDKKILLWKAHTEHKNKVNVSQKSLFNVNSKRFCLPQLKTELLEHIYDQIELLHFSLYSPFELLKKRPKNNFTAKLLPKYLNKNIIIYGYLIHAKYTRTSSKERMYFGTFIDIEGNFIDTVHFPESARRYPFRGKGVYAIYGKVVSEFDFVSIEVNKMFKADNKTDPRYE